MRPLVIVAIDEVVELALLLKEVVRRWFSVPSFVAEKALGLSGRIERRKSCPVGGSAFVVTPVT